MNFAGNRPVTHGDLLKMGFFGQPVEPKKNKPSAVFSDAAQQHIRPPPRLLTRTCLMAVSLPCLQPIAARRRAAASAISTNVSMPQRQLHCTACYPTFIEITLFNFGVFR
ncbi:MAG: hypothetical protein H7238_17315 [Polaromonas sp.]|nr:hypothetical protein [Polaromonas sp.]